MTCHTTTLRYFTLHLIVEKKNVIVRLSFHLVTHTILLENKRHNEKRTRVPRKEEKYNNKAKHFINIKAETLVLVSQMKYTLK